MTPKFVKSAKCRVLFSNCNREASFYDNCESKKMCVKSCEKTCKCCKKTYNAGDQTCEPNKPNCSLNTEEDVPLNDAELEHLNIPSRSGKKVELAKIISKANNIVYTGPKIRIYYVLLYARPNLLVDFAEILKLRVPINYEAMDLGEDVDIPHALSFEVDEISINSLQPPGEIQKTETDAQRERLYTSQKWTAKLLNDMGITRFSNFLLPTNPILMAKENLKASRPPITTTFKKVDFDQHPEYYGLTEDYKNECWAHYEKSECWSPNFENLKSQTSESSTENKVRDLFTETQIQQVIYYKQWWKGEKK